MVCGFCSGLDGETERRFNRADVFKRHLTAVHGVTQMPPNFQQTMGSNVWRASNSANNTLISPAPGATGKCSICLQIFPDAQEFYEHMDGCVLRVIDQEIEAKAKSAVPDNNGDMAMSIRSADNNADVDEDIHMQDEDEESTTASRQVNLTNTSVQKYHGLTHSRGGIPLISKNRGRKARRDYPSSWGFDKGQMNMRKRVMAVFDGPTRRLTEGDMKLSTDHEVRVRLADGKSYVTDLDIQTLKRAEGFKTATDEEKAHWIPDSQIEERDVDGARKLLEDDKERVDDTGGVGNRPSSL